MDANNCATASGVGSSVAGTPDSAYASLHEGTLDPSILNGTEKLTVIRPVVWSTVVAASSTAVSTFVCYRLAWARRPSALVVPTALSATVRVVIHYLDVSFCIHSFGEGSMMPKAAVEGAIAVTPRSVVSAPPSCVWCEWID